MKMLIAGLLGAGLLLALVSLRPWSGEPAAASGDPVVQVAAAATQDDDQIPNAKLVVFRDSCAASAAGGGMNQSQADAYCDCFADNMRQNFNRGQYEAFELRVVEAASESADGTGVVKLFMNDDTLRGIMFGCLEQAQG